MSQTESQEKADGMATVSSQSPNLPLNQSSGQIPKSPTRVKSTIDAFNEQTDTEYFQQQIRQFDQIQTRGSTEKFGEEAMFVDMYSCTFYSMINKYKKKYHLVSEEQSQYYFEALFLIFI